MPEYKLVYFNGRGLAELVRWVFLQGDIAFTDERVEMSEWPEKKKTTPGGKLPLLYIDDKPVWQSMAIARYAATIANLTPQDPIKAAYCDAFVETAKDLLTERFKIVFAEKSEEEKAKEMQEVYLPNVLAPVLDKINKRMETKQYIVDDKLTWADLALARSLDDMTMIFGDELKKKYPAAMAHAAKIMALPKIKEWRATRPDTPF
ncbi:Hematopoietic prostaglandin D synthase [Chionoecetes opilio]|uniref:glutathione transferase n=1 Tax=Chionoecetes opilio TaxID=41210 RepID=A0A8J5CK24_CHIOP|nr:Hematopoietic prostaglandin D synthase [Chionoecetes opilio]